MNVRYQVFISSTFSDLQDERAKVQKTIMQLDCIPAGMELFPAIDEEQFEFIKRIIDDSDYYLLIIGGRYGSLANDGFSYTEKEYDYAVSKGIKVIALIHSNPGALSFDKSEQDIKSRKRLEAFRIKASTNRVVLFWKDASELPSQVALSLPVTIKTYPAIGWVCANSVPSTELYKDFIEIKKENESLKSAISAQNLNGNEANFAGLEDLITIKGITTLVSGYSDQTSSEWTVEASIGELFYNIAPKLVMHIKEVTVYNETGRYLSAKAGVVYANAFYYIDENHFELLRIQLRALNLVALAPVKDNSARSGSALIWSLTDTGEKLLILDKALRKPTN